jgi:hypothetical protein
MHQARVNDCFNLISCPSELVCLELGLKNALAYGHDAGVAGELHDKLTEKQKYGQALAIFAARKMLNECDVVRAAPHDIGSV